jgi:hypothetical protein
VTSEQRSTNSNFGLVQVIDGLLVRLSVTTYRSV